MPQNPNLKKFQKLSFRLADRAMLGFHQEFVRSRLKKGSLCRRHPSLNGTLVGHTRKRICACIHASDFGLLIFDQLFREFKG